MPACSSCGTDIPVNGRFCSACGTPSNTDDVATLDFATATSPLPQRPASSSSSRSPSRPSSSAEYLSEGRFLPGRLLAGRYRIIALLGKGGMGEVYRADDLTLGQPVALKFLPDEAARDQGLLERFKNEVRIARRVSHPNVCRVYDVGDVEGHTFFTMEYVDGEDLASLLRRIGRLPEDKALDIARQLCAGLATAHTKGVLHRDLKPANIMLDGRGQVVITDFGLAGVADQIHGAEVRSGTPAYMAPEQLAGKEVSTRSDIYSLGLVLYEVFTGKRAFPEKTADKVSASGDRTLSRPSSVVKDLNPVIERVILRCLETEPSARPATVLSVAAALPGGDPLAAALAAGETPSPQLVAASGETAGLRSRVAVACFAAVLAALGLVTFLGIHYIGLQKMQLELTPEVLRQKAREIIAQLGYPERPADSAFDLRYDGDFQDYVEKNDKPRPNWDAVLGARPSLLAYWYRQSPDDMVAQGFRDQLLNPGIVTESDPPTTLSGMINVELDPQGRLTYFQAIPPQKDSSSAQLALFDWDVFFSAAGLDLSQFKKAEPAWNSLANSDARMAWTGAWPGTTRPLRVEAASWQGKPVFFSLVGDWTKPDRMKAPESTGKKVQQAITIVLFLALFFGAIRLARLNYRQGRGDRDGALRLAAVMFALEILLWLCRGHMVAGIDSLFLLILAVSTGLFVSGTTWLLYLALEPWVRRRWPQTIISWSRLLSGQFRDPLVGRDILFGVMLGVLWVLIIQIRSIVTIHMGAVPSLGQIEYLAGGREALGAWLMQIPGSILGTLGFFFLLLGLKIVLRKDWLAAIAFVALYALPQGLTSSHMAVDLPTWTLVYAIAVLIVYRFGLIPLACAIFTVNMLSNVPFTADFSAWYVSTFILTLLSVVALAGWGFYHSLGGEPLWHPEME
ncbi:MAG TPA: serine/threonine-protein kinase [Candidatus Eremiobacteraceae bacterium]|nr:serine/threonine-protein kinase [Candidatus Eremiobacteraceae bacterium]